MASKELTVILKAKDLAKHNTHRFKKLFSSHTKITRKIMISCKE